MTYHMQLELTDAKELESNLEFVSGDVGAYRVKIRFTENGKDFDISGYTFTVRGVRPDGKVLSDSGDIDDGYATYTFRNEFYAVPGDLAVHFALSDDKGNYITAKIVHITVLSGVETGQSATDDLSPFTVLLSRMTDRLIRAENLQEDLKQDLSDCAKNGVSVANIADLPENPSLGITHYVSAYADADVPCAVVSGKFSDFFYPYGVTQLGAVTYAFTEKIAAFRDFLYDFEPDSTVPHLIGYVFNTDGTPAGGGALGLNTATGNVLSDLQGFENQDSFVTFCLCKEEQPNISAVYPERCFFWNGTEYKEVCFADRLGDIDKALDEILAMDERILGGDA